ncbi:MAG TPA: lysophospholipid acyltransferase family protein [Bacteroidia bacterium]|nr:1-acyl-sn-glycerol-3-phosphate acyltransferase [Sphingobacteriales bacterium]HPD65211.1 lysophospholipid acyltransferase family protein [Bacteroidia bacterium]HRS58590.1 lysophospholipid acyltransferase family protein [Bacteroidia bacterium]HRU68043.1 lysophospholipid acyltransferase family protein [Bacteroidia bacterium]
MRKLLFVLYQPYKWLFFIPVSFLITFFWGTGAVIFSYFLKPAVVSKIFGVSWAQIILFLTPVKTKIYGRNNIQKNKSYVIIANHSSQYDILLLYAKLGVDFKWVMKKELRAIPGLGAACERMEHIFIDRSTPLGALDTIEKAKKRIVNGTSVIFFPEGTRSRNGEISSFRRGAFKFAFDLGLPILPVTISGTYNVLPPKSWNVRPGTISLHIHPPIDISDYSWKEADILINNAKNIILSPLS